jgi:superfamily I DNA and/or RNA helicase
MPAKIATTDKFQGQQNDYILLSLVRTKVSEPEPQPEPQPQPQPQPQP